MSIMQRCQLKQIKPSPALHAEYTWCAHHAMPHTDTGRCTKWPFTTFHLIQLTWGKICSGLVVLSGEPGNDSNRKVWRWKEGQQWTREEVKAKHGGEEVSHFPFLQSCPWWWPMGVSRVAGTIWAKRQVRAAGVGLKGWVGGGAAGLTCLLLTALSFLRLPHFYGTTHK